MSTLGTAAVGVSLATARRLSPSLILQPDRVQSFFTRAFNGSIASLVQAPPLGGKTVFLKQILKKIEEDKIYKNIFWIEVRTAISLEQFLSTFSSMAKIKAEDLSDLASQFEDLDSLLIVDNFDFVERGFELLEALKNSASNLRLVGSVSFLPEIPTDLAFEVTTFSYGGLSEAEVSDLVTKLKPELKERVKEVFEATLGNPQLLRFYLTSDDFEKSKFEYWNTILGRLSNEAQEQISKAALCKQRYRKSESHFLNSISIHELVALKQMALIVDQEGPGEIRLTDKAKDYIVSKLPQERREDLAAVIIEDLRGNTKILELEEELCWQLQTIGKRREAAEVAKTLVPRLHDKYRFVSIGQLTENIFAELDPMTWNWRRLSIVNARKSLVEVEAIIEALPAKNSIWEALRLIVLSKVELWDELETSTRSFYSKFKVLPPEAEIWAKVAETHLHAVRDYNFDLALKICNEAYAIANKLNAIQPRVLLDTLMGICLIHADAGKITKTLQYLATINEFIAKLNFHAETSVHYAISACNLILIGDFKGVRKLLDRAPEINLEELHDTQRIQMLSARTEQLCVDGKYHQANQLYRAMVPDDISSRITPRIFRAFEQFAHARFVVGANLEVIDLLRSFALPSDTPDSSSKVFAGVLLDALLQADRGRSGLVVVEASREKVTVGDYLRLLICMMEFEWINGQIHSSEFNFDEVLERTDYENFAAVYHQIRLFKFLFALFGNQPFNLEELDITRAFFSERGHHLFALRSELVFVIGATIAGDLEIAEAALTRAELIYSGVESVEDQTWLQVARAFLLKARGDNMGAQNIVLKIDPSSSAAKSTFFQMRLFRGVDSAVVHVPHKDDRISLDTELLVLKDEQGKALIYDRPVLVKLLIALYHSYPSAMTKEEICRKVWEENYNPLVHDTRIYTSVRRLREVLRSCLGFDDPISAVDGAYRASAFVREKIRLIEK